MKEFAIMDGDRFFQRLEPNERYSKSVSGIQTDRHSYSEYTPIFGYDEKWFDNRTVTSYLAGLFEDGRCRYTRPNDYCSYFEPKEDMEDGKTD